MIAKRAVTALVEQWQLGDLSPVDYDLTCGIVLELNQRAASGQQLIDILFMFPRCGLPSQWEGNKGRAGNVRDKVATAVRKNRMVSLSDVFSFTKAKMKAAVLIEQRRQLNMIESQSTSPSSGCGCGSGAGATGQVVTGLLVEEPSMGVASADNTHTREHAGASNAASGRDLSTADVDEMVPIPAELPQMISRLTAAKLYQCTVARSCITRSFLDMVSARQVHKYPEEDRKRLRLKARYCAEQHHLGLGNGGDPLVLPLRPAAAESFVSPRPSPDCGLGKRRSIPVGAIESVQKFKCLKQMEVTQLRRQVADAEKGVTGLLVRVQEVVSELDSRGEKVAKLEKRLEKLQAQRAADQERIAGQAKQLAQAKRSSWEKAQSTEQQLAELEVKVRERLGEELVAQKAHAEQYAGRKRKQAQRAKTESGRKIQSLEDRNAAILKMLDGWRETQSNVVTEVTLENDRAVKSFATKINGKQYAPRIRAMYYCMLSDGVPTRKCEQHLRDILQLAGIKLDDDVKLPGQKAAAGMVADVQALTHIQMARRTLKAADGSISFGCDGARKSYGGQSKDRFAVVQSVSRAGAGTEIITTPVAVVDMLGGDGLSHTEAFEYVYAEAAGCWNIRNRVEGSTERIESTALTKKFVGGCTDSCAAQQVGNRGVFRTIDAARAQDAHVGVADDLGAEEEAGATPVPVPLLQPGSATPCDMVQMEGELRV